MLLHNLGSLWAGAVVSLTLCPLLVLSQTAGDTALSKALEVYRSGDCKAALPLLEATNNVGRTGPLLGRCYLEVQDFNKARDVLTRYREAAASDEGAAVLMARSHQLEGNLDQAITALEAFSKQYPDALGARVTLGDLYTQAKKRTEAESIYKAILTSLPADVQALVGLGNLAASDSKWAEASGFFQKAIDAAPANGAALLGMGSALLQLGKNDAALPILERAALVRPEDWELAKLLAGAQMKAGKWPQMVQTMEYHSLEHANEQRVTAWMGEAFTHVKEPARAEEYYKAVIKNSPTNLTARLLLGDLLYGAKRLKETKVEYAAALKLKPDLPEVNDRMGQMAELDGSMKEARDFYDAACSSPTATVPMKMRLSRAYFATDEVPKARATLESVLRAEPQHKEAKSMLARVASKTAQWDEAVRLSSELLSTDRKNIPMLRILGEALYRRNVAEDLPKAQEALQAVISGDPNDRGAKLLLAHIEAKSQQWDEAARYANELLAADRNNVEILRILAESSSKRKREAEATEYLEQILALENTDRAARFQLCNLYMKLEALNRMPRALELMKDYVKKNPDDAEGYLLLATLHKRGAEPEAAHEFFQRGFEKVPNQIPAHLAWAYDGFGTMLYAEGKYEEAATYQVKAVEMNPTDDQALFNLALTYAHLRKEEEVTAIKEKLKAIPSPLLESLDEELTKIRRSGRRPAPKKK